MVFGGGNIKKSDIIISRGGGVRINFKNKKTVLLASVLSLVVVLAIGTFVWLKYHQASADTNSGNWVGLEHCTAGPNYAFAKDNNWSVHSPAGFGQTTAGMQLVGKYSVLGNYPATPAKAFDGKPVVYSVEMLQATDWGRHIWATLGVGSDYNPRYYTTSYHLIDQSYSIMATRSFGFGVTGDFSAFQDINLTTTELPEKYSAKIFTTSGQTIEETAGNLTYKPNAPLMSYSYRGASVQMQNINKVEFYRVAGNNPATKELLMACDLKHKVANSAPIPKVIPTEGHGLTAHVAFGIPKDQVQVTSFTAERIVFSVPPTTDPNADLYHRTQYSLGVDWLYNIDLTNNYDISNYNHGGMNIPVTDESSERVGGWKVYLANGHVIINNQLANGETWPLLSAIKKIEYFRDAELKNSLVTLSRDPLPNEYTLIVPSPSVSTTASPTASVSATPITTMTATNTITATVTPISSRTVAPTSTFSIGLSVTPNNGTTSDLFTVKATVDDPSKAYASTNYSLWWNCDNASTSVADTIKVCGQPRIKGDTKFTQQQRNTGFKADNVFTTTNGQKITVNTFQGSKYYNAGTRTIKLIVERNGQALEKRQAITVKSK